MCAWLMQYPYGFYESCNQARPTWIVPRFRLVHVDPFSNEVSKCAAARGDDTHASNFQLACSSVEATDARVASHNKDVHFIV